MQDCRKYDWCSCPMCPLDLEQELRVALSGEPKCRLLKAERFKLGEGLPRHGLTKKEWAGKQASEKIKNELNNLQTSLS